MRPSKLCGDDHGREAFAYLAVLLLLMTGTFASYVLMMQDDQERRSRDLGRIFRTRAGMDQLLRELRPSIIDLHGSCLSRAEEIVLENENLRLYGVVESEMARDLAALLKERLDLMNASDATVGWTVSNMTVDSRPIMADMDGPVPEAGPAGGNITESLEGGASSYAPKPESLGVNTSITVEVTARGRSGGLMLSDSLKVHAGRLSPVDVMRSRGDRFEDALNTGELARTVSYMLGTLAQSKAHLGHGRDVTVPSGEAPGPVLTHEEVAACVDLSVALLARGHLGCVDEGLLNGSGRMFRKAPGAGGDVPDLYALVAHSDNPMDPSLLALLSEGLFSGSNPPSLEKMLRPLLKAALESLVIRMLNYTGREERMLQAVGGLAALMDLAVRGFDSATRTLFGTELLRSSELVLDGTITGIMADGGLTVPEGGFMMASSFPNGPLWEGTAVTDYPELEVPEISREVQVYISGLSDDDVMYLSANGTVHSRADYFDPADLFLGYRCEMYTIDLTYDVRGLRPDFDPVDILEENDTRLELMELLGRASSSGDGTTGSELMDLGRRVVEEGIDALLSFLSENGDGLWDDVWTGWSPEDLPELDAELVPFSLAMVLSRTALDSVVELLSERIAGSASVLDLMGKRADHRSMLGRAIADHLLEGYDRLVDRERQEEEAYASALPRLHEHGNIVFRSLRPGSEEVIFAHRDQVHVDPTKDVSKVLDDDERLLELAMAIGDDGPGHGPLLEALYAAVTRSFELVRSRELGTGSDGREPGIVRASLCGTLTRSGQHTPATWDLDEDLIGHWARDLLNDTLGSIEGHFTDGLSIFGSRVLAPACANVSMAEPRDRTGRYEGVALKVRLERDEGWTASVIAEDGVHNTDPEDEDAPAFRTPYSVLFSATYTMCLQEAGRTVPGRALDMTLPVDLEVEIEVSSAWGMEGAAYNGTGTVWEKVTDIARDATDAALDRLLNGSTDLLGGTLGSLNEVPPIIRDIISGKDLDIAEMARVLSNVTLDLSRSLREAVKEAIGRLVALGVEGTITVALDLLGIDRLELGMDIAGSRLDLVSYRKVLMGGNGTLLDLRFSAPVIGLEGAFNIVREEDRVLFFGNVTYDKGPLHIRLLLDPFMTRLPHMVSIEGALEGPKDVRFSFACPALKEYRSLEISIRSSLGVEILVPIPFLGVQAVIDAGLRIRYSRPEEMAPHLNEARFQGGNLTSIEIFDPRMMPVHGCTVELRNGDGSHVCTWEVRGGPSTFKDVKLTAGNLLRWSRPLTPGGGAEVVLRSPSGESLDDLVTDEVKDGDLSRDRDGYGVFRWTAGTPGASNGGSIAMGLYSLIFSIASDSLKEAYEEASSLYPLSFEMAIHLIERAIELFVERLVSLVRELVIEARLFIHVEIEDATGSGGAGFELSFIALGDALADLLEWLYRNIKAFMGDMLSGAGSGSFLAFPLDILEDCFVELLVLTQAETPVPLSKMAPQGVEVPDSFTMGIVAGYNIALPMRLLGVGAGSWAVYGGVYIMECPSALVSLFYDIASIGTTSDLWLLRISIWEEDRG